MREIGWSLYCLAVGLALGLAQEEAPANYLKTVDQSVNNTEKEEPRSDTPKNKESDDVVTSEIKTLRNEPPTLGETNRLALGSLKDGDLYNSLKHSQGQTQDKIVSTQNDYKYDAIQNDDLSRSAMPEPHSRLIPYNEHILLHQIPGGNHLVSCSREGELHNVWSYEYQCLVCACVRDNGLLRSVCASCNGCMPPGPDVVTPSPYYSTPAWHTIPDGPVTAPTPPFEEEVTCRPLPAGVPFENPLHPCQICVCTESINAYGKPDVNIQCQENPQCILPTDATPIPYNPDNPVPSPYCDKIPLNVYFPHPSDACQTCRCTEQLSQGMLVKELSCQPNPDCAPQVITELPFYPTEPDVVPITEIVPAWPPVTVPPRPPHGPLPGPSPHDSCQPYTPNQPFQHPWDECQMCVCTEAFAREHVTVEINCYTKKSCCIEPPFDVVIPATLPPAQYRPGKLQIQDAICEFKTFGVEFVHPKDPCNVCTCEPQGYYITSFCKRSSKPECLLYPVIPEEIIGNPRLPGSTGSYSDSSASASAQSQAIKDAFYSYQKPYGSNGLPIGSQISAGQNNQKYQLPETELNLALNAKNIFSSQGLTQMYRPQEKGQELVYPNQGQGYQGGANSQNYIQQIDGYYPGHIGMMPGLMKGKEYTSQAQASASAQSNSYGYAPGYQYPGYQYPGYLGSAMRPGGKAVSSAQSSASSHGQAQASAQSSAKFKTRSGNVDDNKSAETEN